MLQKFVSFFAIFLAYFVGSAYSQCQNSADNYINGLCYTIVKDQKSFFDAQQYCHTQNNGRFTNLAVIQNGIQANFLASMMDVNTNFWIGLSRAASNARFTWDDGTIMYWNYFDNRYPSDSNYAAEMSVNGKWRTIDPNTKLPFVCSYNPLNVGTTGYPGTAGTVTAGTTAYATATGATSTTGYPWSTGVFTGSTGYPSTGSTGYPWSTGYFTGSTGYPASVPTSTPATGSTGYATSYSATGSTGYPASGVPTGYPTTGSFGYTSQAPTDYPKTGTPGYFTGSTGTTGTAATISYSVNAEK